ncbi:hypothetical protein THAOC_27401, partial [Thalassiosira oceanica]
QSSDDTPPPDNRLDEDAPAATDASSTARTAPRHGGRIRGKTPHPRGIPVDLQGGAEARAVAARNAALPAVREAAVVFGTLPMTVLAVMRFVPERATLKDGGGQLCLATTRRRNRPGKGGKCNGHT